MGIAACFSIHWSAVMIRSSRQLVGEVSIALWYILSLTSQQATQVSFSSTSFPHISFAKSIMHQSLHFHNHPLLFSLHQQFHFLIILFFFFSTKVFIFIIIIIIFFFFIILSCFSSLPEIAVTRLQSIFIKLSTKVDSGKKIALGGWPNTSFMEFFLCCHDPWVFIVSADT